MGTYTITTLGAATELLTLPLDQPLAEWTDPRIVQVPRGISRHVVRFVRAQNQIFAFKEATERYVIREHHLLRALADASVPVVDAFGTVTERTDTSGEVLGSLLITRHLPYSLPYRALFTERSLPDLRARLLDALAQLFVRLHLAGFFWGDCSLSNTLFRRDAGSLAAYLVDAETGEMHEQLTIGQRTHDITIATENIAGELMDLQAGGYLSEDADPIEMAIALQPRYEKLWTELTDDQVYSASESYKIEERVRRLNSLGFDVSEIGIRSEDAGRTLRFETHIVEPGHHARRVYALTGLQVQENQAKGMLSDLARFRAKWIEGVGHDIPEDLAARRWLDEKFYGVLSMVPAELRKKLPDAELFHEIGEHRWLMSERLGRDVGRPAAVEDYVRTVLAKLPDASVRILTEPTTEELPVVAE
ncbi:DUF4032 domain-containing protein [Jatrophihabitans telluris]|uniref:DUF4032 domain-containing protein n=1 Tax=Jatrophihabitans telluris TaxID=2038343 RepID=A0ABY4R551_9ACTN|nr:DUF4032 domain-containing protein [Jatrophihabitans telluris]UQX90162.1 DUF4032 domain-containing protein [Jatrophihabitans telluris]